MHSVHSVVHSSDCHHCGSRLTRRPLPRIFSRPPFSPLFPSPAARINPTRIQADARRQSHKPFPIACPRTPPGSRVKCVEGGPIPLRPRRGPGGPASLLSSVILTAHSLGRDGPSGPASPLPESILAGPKSVTVPAIRWANSLQTPSYRASSRARIRISSRSVKTSSATSWSGRTPRNVASPLGRTIRAFGYRTVSCVCRRLNEWAAA